MSLPVGHPLRAVQDLLPVPLRGVQRCPSCAWHEMGDGAAPCSTCYYVKILLEGEEEMRARHARVMAGGRNAGDDRLSEWVDRAQRLARIALKTIYP